MPRTVLIIEDDQEMRELLAHYLRKEGFSPVVATDGESGLARARADPDRRLAIICIEISVSPADISR